VLIRRTRLATKNIDRMLGSEIDWNRLERPLCRRRALLPSLEAGGKLSGSTLAGAGF
jgi:hypothetical protein